MSIYVIISFMPSIDRPSPETPEQGAEEKPPIVPRLVIDPLAAHILDGKFKPASDNQGRNHTLNILAYAAFKNGDHERPSAKETDFMKSNGQSLVVARYIPRSWANTVQASVFGVEIGATDTTKFFAFAGLVLQATGSVHPLSLRVQPNVEEASELLLLGTDLAAIPLKPGPHIDKAQKTIAKIALGFFDEAYLASDSSIPHFPDNATAPIIPHFPDNKVNPSIPHFPDNVV